MNQRCVGRFVYLPPLAFFSVVALLDITHDDRLNQAFQPGKHFIVPAMPNITAVNALGDFAIAADRLAIIDGEGQY